MTSIRLIFLSLSLLLCQLLQLALGLNNGLARTPPMGWIAWERFTCTTNCDEFPDDCISEQLFKSMADRLVEDGYASLGYEYVDIDDCWSEMERDPRTEHLVADRKRFPSGILPLAHYIHERRLKLGLYGDCGTRTCDGYPAQLKSEANLTDNYFDLDAQSLVDWHVDSFKFDGCYLDALKAESICPQMSHALKARSPRDNPILMSCEWPFYLLRQRAAVNFELAAQSCNTWRYYEDVQDAWLSILNIVDFSVNLQDTIVKYHGPGQWFDPDQLVIGNFGLSLEQARAQMALWCLWSAPLYMSNDLRRIEPQMAAVLKNEHLIGVDQDPLGVFGLMVGQTGDKHVQAFVKPVEPIRKGCPSFVVVYLNRDTLGNRVQVSFSLRQLLAKAPIEAAARHYQEVYGIKKPDGNFDTDHCLRRLTQSMTKEPVPDNLLVRPLGEEATVTLEETPVEYDVIELFEFRRLPKVQLNSSLELPVVPSGATIVKLIELN